MIRTGYFKNIDGKNDELIKRYLETYGLKKENIFIETCRKINNQPELDKLIQQIKEFIIPPGSELYIINCNVLYNEIDKRTEFLKLLIKNKIILRVIKFPFTLETFLDINIVEQVNNAYLNMFITMFNEIEILKRNRERLNINTQSDLNRSSHLKGRKTSLIPLSFEEMFNEYVKGNLSVLQMSKELNVNRKTVQKWVDAIKYLKKSKFKKLNSREIDFENLYHQFINKEKSLDQIAIDIDIELKLIKEIVEYRVKMGKPELFYILFKEYKNNQMNISEFIEKLGRDSQLSKMWIKEYDWYLQNRITQNEVYNAIELIVKEIKEIDNYQINLPDNIGYKDKNHRYVHLVEFEGKLDRGSLNHIIISKIGKILNLTDKEVNNLILKYDGAFFGG